MSQPAGGPSWSHYAIAAVTLFILLYIPAVRSLITAILEGLK